MHASIWPVSALDTVCRMLASGNARLAEKEDRGRGSDKGSRAREGDGGRGASRE